MADKPYSIFPSLETTMLMCPGCDAWSIEYDTITKMTYTKWHVSKGKALPDETEFNEFLDQIITEHMECCPKLAEILSTPKESK